MESKTTSRQPDWQSFAAAEQLTPEQLVQFQKYVEFLLKWNELIDLTAITEPANIIAYHFQDSLMAGRYVDLNTITTIADVGTGAGFPAVPLKIKYPHLKLVLIEVTYKRVAFLETLIAQLGLTDIEIYELDWRTFLRKTEYPIDLFVTRAALQPNELIRMFKPSSPYKNAELIYWAGPEWTPTGEEKEYVVKQVAYGIKHKRRQLVWLKKA